MGSVLCSQAGSRGLLGPASRMHFLADSCISTKGNTFGVDFQLRRPPAKQQGPGSQRQPRPSLVLGDQRARGEKGQRCFAEQRRIMAVVCSPTRVKVSRMHLPEYNLEPFVRWGLSADLPSRLHGFAGACVQKAFSCQFLLRHEGEHVWSGFQGLETTSKAAGPREPEAAQTLFVQWKPEG